jgi:hypothetical protein
MKVDFTQMIFIGSGNEWEVIRMLEATIMAVAQSSSIFNATDVIAAHAVLVEDVTNDDNFSNRQRGNDPVTWCWKETSSQMSGHDCTMIVPQSESMTLLRMSEGVKIRFCLIGI